MPGHNHSIAGNMVVGDLNSHEALWLWNCPVTNEELDIWHHINEYLGQMKFVHCNQIAGHFADKNG